MKAQSAQGTEHDAKRMAALEETITHYVMIPPNFANYPLIEDILWSGVQEVMTGKYAAKESLILMEKKYARFSYDPWILACFIYG
jgi:hypothetical protein